jgi:hypothetical protein
MAGATALAQRARSGEARAAGSGWEGARTSWGDDTHAAERQRELARVGTKLDPAHSRARGGTTRQPGWKLRGRAALALRRE